VLQATLDNDEQRVGADIIKRALPYSLRLIANNSGQNGSVVVDKVRRARGVRVLCSCVRVRARASVRGARQTARCVFLSACWRELRTVSVPVCEE
jgi:chaperonin GroEL (HSP60 family)